MQPAVNRSRRSPLDLYLNRQAYSEMYIRGQLRLWDDDKPPPIIYESYPTREKKASRTLYVELDRSTRENEIRKLLRGYRPQAITIIRKNIRAAAYIGFKNPNDARDAKSGGDWAPGTVIEFPVLKVAKAFHGRDIIENPPKLNVCICGVTLCPYFCNRCKQTYCSVDCHLDGWRNHRIHIQHQEIMVSLFNTTSAQLKEECTCGQKVCHSDYDYCENCKWQYCDKWCHMDELRKHELHYVSVTMCDMMERLRIAEKIKEKGADQVQWKGKYYRKATDGHNLAYDMEMLLKEQLHSDVTLTCGDKSLPAHKAILAVRSPVFRAMFDSPLQESETGNIDIVDIEYTVLKEMLQFIYTGKDTEQIVEMAAEILPAANKYQLDELKALCEEHLLRDLNVGNVVTILVLADMHNSSNLKTEAEKFIGTHKVDVMNTEDWKEMFFNRTALAFETVKSPFLCK